MAEAKWTEAGSGSESDVRKDVEELRNDVRKLTATLEHLAQSGLASGSARMSEQYERARAQAQDIRARAGEAADTATQQARSAVAERPLGTVAAAVGLGVVIGL